MLMFRIVAPRSLTRCVYITNKLFSPVKVPSPGSASRDDLQITSSPLLLFIRDSKASETRKRARKSQPARVESRLGRRFKCTVEIFAMWLISGMRLSERNQMCYVRKLVLKQAQNQIKNSGACFQYHLQRFFFFFPL